MFPHPFRYTFPVLIALVIVATVAAPVWPDTPVYRGEPTSDFFQSWLLCGPFPLQAVDDADPGIAHLPGFETDFLARHGGESDPSIVEGQKEEFPGGSNTWIAHKSVGREIDLDQAFSDHPYVLAYGYCEIELSAPRACVLALGTNDGARVWLNGEVIWDVAKGRALQPDSDLIPVLLREGKNTLLLKVEERGGAWGFACRLLPFDSPDLTPDHLKLFRVVTREDGTAYLRSFLESADFSSIVEKMSLEASSAEAPDEVVWSADNPEGDEITIGVNSESYGEYILRVHATLTDGVQHTFTLPFTVGQRIEHTLFADGATGYHIVVGEDASESERWAALELRHWLRTIGGADFPIRTDSSTPRSLEIVVGFNRRAKALLGPEAMRPADDDESFRYQNLGSSILIWGGSQRGTMYGVFSFLERELGCRWYTPRVSVAPERDAYRFHYLRHAESPGLRVRNVFYYEAFDPIWAARNRSNGLLTFSGVRDQIGGVDSYWAVHTFYRFLPPSEFFEAHPEYYSQINGKRVAEHAQLCLSNLEVRRIVKERALAYMREYPEHRIYSVSQNDGYGPCQCSECQALVEREGSESGPILQLVNEVAEAAESEFPDKYIGTLAYVYSRKPPKNLRPRPNVIMRLCSFECCRGHDFYSCPKNETFLRDIQNWAQIAPHLYIWDYVVEFGHYLMPYPNFKALQRNIQCFRENNAIGVMSQAAYQSRGGEFAELRMYVLSKLLWNPDCDVNAAVDDFMVGYYGRSGQYVRAYFDLMHERVTPDVHLHQFNPEVPFFSDELIRKADAIFDRAEVVAENEEIRRRVEMARLPIMYVKCVRSPSDARRDGTYERFKIIAEREGITHYAERGAPHREAFHKKVEASE